MAVYYFVTTASAQHVAHDSPTLTTNAQVLPGAFYAFPNTLLPAPAIFSNAHYTVNANQSGDSPGLRIPSHSSVRRYRPPSFRLVFTI